MTHSGLKSVLEPIRVGDREKPVVQDREDPNPVARVLFATEHRFMGDPHVDSFFRRSREVEGGQPR
jgi:hypothetical protein